MLVKGAPTVWINKSVPLFSQIFRIFKTLLPGEFLDTFVYYMCSRSSYMTFVAVMAPVKYECDSKNIAGSFATPNTGFDTNGRPLVNSNLNWSADKLWSHRWLSTGQHSLK